MWKGRDETKKSIHLCCSDTIGCSTVFNISHTIYWSCAIPIECWLVSLTGKVNIILVVLSCIALILIANMNGIQMSQHFISFISHMCWPKKEKEGNSIKLLCALSYTKNWYSLFDLNVTKIWQSFISEKTIRENSRSFMPVSNKNPPDGKKTKNKPSWISTCKQKVVFPLVCSEYFSNEICLDSRYISKHSCAVLRMGGIAMYIISSHFRNIFTQSTKAKPNLLPDKWDRSSLCMRTKAKTGVL